MTGSTISGTITHTVRLGNGHHSSPLTITATGDVAPAQYGATGVVVRASAAGAMIDNQGHIAGAYGGDYATGGGIGVDCRAMTDLNNSGVIAGGSVGYFSTHSGGVGVYLHAGGNVLNTGSILAGNAGYYSTVYGADGIALRGGGNVTNHGTIAGGRGDYGMRGSGHGGAGGDGVNLQGASLDNDGIITGGAGGSSNDSGGGTGGVGAYLAGADSLVNSGQIVGGSGASYSYADGGAGGIGVSLGAGATLENSGLIAGGRGDSYSKNYGGAGGTGVTLAGASASNAGTILGGRGGEGRYGGSPGGTGLMLASGALTNSGLIAGGTGGASNEGNAGYGGSGVVMAGGSLTNDGTITGGAGYTDRAGGSAGGAGILLEGGTLIVNGLVAGGANEDGTPGTADAIVMSGGKLTLDPGAAFTGIVAATATAGSVLNLAGTGGSLSGLGTEFTGFGTLKEAAQATWTLTGSNTLGGRGSVQLSGQLQATGTLTGLGNLTVSEGGELLATGTGFVQAGRVTLAGGTLLATDTATVIIGSGDTDAPLSVKHSGSISGFGTVGGAAPYMIDNGGITAQGGTLDIASSVFGTGALAIDSGAGLMLQHKTDVGSLSFAAAGNATLLLSSSATVSNALAGFGAGDVIDVAEAATAFTYAGGTLTLENHQAIVESLIFSGSYTQDSFAIHADGHGGTDIIYQGATAAVIRAPWADDWQAGHPGAIGHWHPALFLL